MSRKFIIGVVLVLTIVVTAFSIFITQNTQPKKMVTLASVSLDLPDPKIVGIFVSDESKSYTSLRGVITSKTSNEIKIVANTGGNNMSTYQINDKTRMICLEKKYENTWLDFHEILDNHRVYDKYPEKYVARELTSLDTSGKQQVIFSKSKDTSFPDILWVIGCVSEQ